MASSNSTNVVPTLIPIADKLHHGNILIWRAQTIVTICGTQLVVFLPEGVVLCARGVLGVRLVVVRLYVGLDCLSS